MPGLDLSSYRKKTKHQNPNKKNHLRISLKWFNNSPCPVYYHLIDEQVRESV